MHATVEVDTPKSWQAALPGQAKVAVLRLCDGRGPVMPGWCTAAVDLHGPEVEVMCGGINSKQPTHAGIWRQGNLLHFGFEPAPGEFNPTGRKLLLNAIAYIARFTSDRPIMRVKSFVDPAGSGAPTWRLDYLLSAPKTDAAGLGAAFAAPWGEQIAALPLDEARAFVQERRRALRAEGAKLTFDADALALGVDVRRPGVLLELAAMLRGEQDAAARRLLLRLVPDGPGPDTTPANWGHWLKPRAGALCFDPFTHAWRLDPLAYWRDVASDALRGPARADAPAQRDPAAVELAARIVARHGGDRALADLASFSCRQGNVRSLWDRRNGFFRRENGGSIPAGNFGTPWKVAIFDTAADADRLRGGGPEPRPFVSARGGYTEVVERMFLPLLLLRPDTHLRLLDADERGDPQLEVRLGGRGMLPQQVHVLHVDPETGDVRAIDVRSLSTASTTTWIVEGTVMVGPLRLLARFRSEGRRERELEFTDAEWNPPIPEGAATSPETLLGGG